MVDRRRGPAGVDAVEIDEAERLVRAVLIRHAGAQRAGHERQVRVGVLRLRGFCSSVSSVRRSSLSCSYPAPSGNIVRNSVDVGHDAGAALVEPRGDALIEIAGGRVERAAERPRIVVERVAVRGGH